jgi:hypothetical protein
MRASSVSLPTRVARTIIRPLLLSDAPITREPGETSIGIDSPVSIELLTEEGPIDVKTTIQCDFLDIPEKYHEVVLNMLTVKYLNKVSFGNNPFSECKPIVKRKWWQFWKKEYILKD